MRADLATFYRERRVCVTGGAGFIGSHLVEALVELGAVVMVLDDLSTGTEENLGRDGTIRVPETCDLARFERRLRQRLEAY